MRCYILEEFLHYYTALSTNRGLREGAAIALNLVVSKFAAVSFPRKKKYFLSDRLNVCTLCIQGGIFFYRSLFGSNLVFTSLECHKRTLFDTMRQISTMVVTVFIAAYQHIINKLLVRMQSDKVNSRCDGIPPVGPS